MNTRDPGFGHAFTTATASNLIVVFAIFAAVIFNSGAIADFIERMSR